jgi:hypothetical protein
MKVKFTEISRELVYQCYADRIDTKAYWDFHGKAIPWDGSQTFKYNRRKKVDLYRVEKRLESEYIKSYEFEPYEFEELELFVDGERLTDIGQITKFKEFKTKVRLDCCVGAG